MTRTSRHYSIGELAHLSGVSVRALHHYDTIGLLQPVRSGQGAYRVYREEDVLRLQEILFYRAMDMPLSQIGSLLDAEPDRLTRLRAHRSVLVDRADQARRMLATLDDTIAALEENRTMSNEDIYRPFAPEKQAEYEAWLTDTYGADMADAIEHSKQTHADASERMQAFMARLEEIETGLVTHFDAGIEAASDENAELLEAHRQLMSEIWGKPCPVEGVSGLADLYLSHPDFVARYERLSPRFSQYLAAAMKAHASRLKIT